MKALSDSDMSAFFWWHTIDLGNGMVTPGFKTADIMQQEFKNTFSQLDVRGKSVLDVGAWNGGFSIEAARRGASRVVAIDHYTWNHPSFNGRKSFDFAVNHSGYSNIEAVDIDLDSSTLSLSFLGQFDIVLYLGVFYHLFDPIAATREISALAKEVMLVETHIEEIEGDRPAMVFFPTDELNGDSTNWWATNTLGMIALLKCFGFRTVDATLKALPPCREVFVARR